LNIREIGCDYYSASPHKWLQAPKGTGFLYVRDEVIDRTWNTIATEGWEDPKIRAERFQRIGSANVPALSGCALPWNSRTVSAWNALKSATAS
jgi:isopenicillin-N epimerase